MAFHAYVYLFIALLIAIIYLSIAFYAWQRRSVPGAAGLAILMLAAAGYAVPYIFELNSPNLAAALFWMHVSLPGASLVGPAWLLFAAHYTAQKTVFTPRWILLLVVIPVVTCLVAWTNSLHGLYGTGFQFDPSAQWPVLKWHFGPLYWINFGYAYLTTIAGMLLLLRSAVRRMRVFTNQALLLIVGAFIPALINILFSLGITPIPDMDLTPFSFLVAGVFWSLALFRFRLLDIVPIAREHVLDTMPIGVVVLDRQGRVLDMNPAAGRMLGLPPLEMAGHFLAGLGPAFPFSLAELSSAVEIEKEVRLGADGAGRFLLQRLTPIARHGKGRTGALLLVEDITFRKRAELAERAQHDLAETLREAASDLNVALPLPEMLDRILANLAKFLVFDAAQISVWNGPGEDEPLPPLCRFVTSRPIDERSSSDTVPLGQAYPAPLMEAATASRGPFRVARPALSGGCPASFDRSWVSSALGMPVRARGALIGLALVDRASPDGFSDDELERLELFAGQAAIAIENARLYARLEIRAVQDDLTKVYNRRGLAEIAVAELNRAHRFKHPLGLILFDLDYYKGVNDTYGHAAGDEVLCTVARICRAAIREIDVIGRYGGDEFVVILPECNLEAAAIVAERMRKALESSPIKIGEEELVVTLSAGVAVDLVGHLTLDDLLRQADQALYAAKSAGRNCVR
jgi:diguanylate cyclase (GGDEF)-like protein/PAS domain S-box-containing protein